MQAVLKSTPHINFGKRVTVVSGTIKLLHQKRKKNINRNQESIKAPGTKVCVCVCVCGIPFP
jgi:hypothetical protein